MATPIDTSLLGQFSIIFPFLLVFCIVYALLQKTKAIGDNKGLSAIIAVVFGILTIFFPIVRDTLNVMAPWFVLFMFGILFVLLLFMIFGVSMGDISGVLKSEEYGYINTWIVGIGLLIVIGSLLTVVSDYGGLGKNDEGGYTITSGAEGNQERAFWNTLTHPKVLGMVLILLIATLTVSRLAGKNS